MSKFGNPEINKQRKSERDQKIKDFIANNTVKSNFLKNVPQSKQWLFYEVYTGNSSLKKATKAKCLDCSCFEIENIKKCEVFTCPLYSVRPFKD